MDIIFGRTYLHLRHLIIKVLQIHCIIEQSGNVFHFNSYDNSPANICLGEDELKTSGRRFYGVFSLKISLFLRPLKDFFKTSSKRIAKTSLQDVSKKSLKTRNCYALFRQKIQPFSDLIRLVIVYTHQ